MTWCGEQPQAVYLSRRRTPNAHLPDPESEERKRLAEEFERGRRAALDELENSARMPQHTPFQSDSSCSYFVTASYYPNVTASYYPTYSTNTTGEKE